MLKICLTFPLAFLQYQALPNVKKVHFEVISDHWISWGPRKVGVISWPFLGKKTITWALREYQSVQDILAKLNIFWT